MISPCESNCLATETSDAAFLHISCTQSVQQLSDVPHTGDDDDRHTETCMLSTEDEKLMNDVQCFNDTLLLKKQLSSFHDQDYVEKIKEFQLYVDTVKKIARPGCSSEMLNVALSSISSLIKTLSVVSSNRYLHASL